MILDLSLQPGTMIDELSLAAEIGLGRTPVHEAVARLVTDRLVTVLPRRGLMIVPIGLDLLREIFEAREALECGNAYFAAQHITDAELETLRCFIEKADQARQQADIFQFLEDDQHVHRYLASCAHNTFLQDATNRILMHSLRFWRFYFSTYHGEIEALLSHQPLLEALTKHDAQQAAERMREHIHHSRALLNKLF
jgi:DNA-binding GntR family transcriptional regulator